MSNVTLRIDDVSIRCMGCSQISSLEDAIRAGWKMCKNCNFTICSVCYNDLGTEKFCLSYTCSSKKKLIEPVGLPVDKIIIFAQQNFQTDYQQGLLYKLFYKDGSRLHAPAFFAARPQQEPEPPEDQRPTKIQEEAWKNFRLVITKRRGGKFITWERVI